jgi:hypothetical protein
VKQARFGQPVHARHFTAAVKGVEAGEGVITPDVTFTGDNDRYPGTGNTGLVVNEGGVPDPDAGHIGNSVLGAWRYGSNDDAQVP